MSVRYIGIAIEHRPPKGEGSVNDKSLSVSQTWGVGYHYALRFQRHGMKYIIIHGDSRDTGCRIALCMAFPEAWSEGYQ